LFVSERLAAAILANRDDVDLYLVYADELQRAGDPRGELIVMQNRIQAVDDSKKRHALQRTCDDWIARHDLLGPLRAFGRSVFERHAEVTWRFGFIRCLEIGWGPKATGETPATARDTLAAILQHPSSAFLTYLVLGPAPGVGNRMSMECLLDAIVDTRQPAALRTLYLGKYPEWSRPQTTTGEIGRASSVLRRLQKLTLDAGTVAIGDLELPELAELRIEVGTLDPPAIDALYAIRCPKLTKLTVRLDRSPLSNAELTAKLRAKLPHVRHVSVAGLVNDL
jgi:uncharacterized protein (TIGR02996 family)